MASQPILQANASNDRNECNYNDNKGEKTQHITQLLTLKIAIRSANSILQYYVSMWGKANDILLLNFN